MKRAIKCYEEMKRAGILPVRITYNTLIQGFVLSDRVEDGEEMLKYTIRYDHTVTSVLIRTVCMDHSVRDADQMSGLIRHS